MFKRIYFLSDLFDGDGYSQTLMMLVSPNNISYIGMLLYFGLYLPILPLLYFKRRKFNRPSLVRDGPCEGCWLNFN